MQKIALPERPDLRAKAEAQGFSFLDMYGEPYWDESTCYSFSLNEVEELIEDPATELHAMCREAVGHVLEREDLLERLRACISSTGPRRAAARAHSSSRRSDQSGV